MNLDQTSVYVEVTNLGYRIGNNQILENLNFKIPENASTFILGNNGSGKSTLIDILTENIKGYTGKFHLRKIPKGNSGVLFDTIPFSPTLKVKELIRLFTMVFDGKPDSSDFYLEKLQLRSLFDKQFKVLSLGEKKRLGLFLALFHNPTLLILDEPFGGIDPNSLNTISSLLFSQERTAIISSITGKLQVLKRIMSCSYTRESNYWMNWFPLPSSCRTRLFPFPEKWWWI